MKQDRIRILNKTSKTVTLKLNGRPMTFSWEEFNKKLVVVDKVWAVPNAAEEEKYKKVEELLEDAMVSFLIARATDTPMTKLTHMANLGKISKEVCALLECTPLEFASLLQDRLKVINPFMVNPLWSEKEDESREEYEKEAEENEVKDIDSGKPTFGDAFSCLSELKEKMNK